MNQTREPPTWALECLDVPQKPRVNESVDHQMIELIVDCVLYGSIHRNLQRGMRKLRYTWKGINTQQYKSLYVTVGSIKFDVFDG